MDGTPKLTSMPIFVTRVLHPVIEESLTEPTMYRVPQLRFKNIPGDQILENRKAACHQFISVGYTGGQCIMTQVQQCENVEE